jgi:hypothetical protein
MGPHSAKKIVRCYFCLIKKPDDAKFCIAMLVCVVVLYLLIHDVHLALVAMCDPLSEFYLSIRCASRLCCMSVVGHDVASAEEQPVPMFPVYLIKTKTLLP